MTKAAASHNPARNGRGSSRAINAHSASPTHEPAARPDTGCVVYCRSSGFIAATAPARSPVARPPKSHPTRAQTQTSAIPSAICSPTMVGSSPRASSMPNHSHAAKKGTSKKEKPNGRMCAASTISSPRTKARARSMNSTESANWYPSTRDKASACRTSAPQISQPSARSRRHACWTGKGWWGGLGGMRAGSTLYLVQGCWSRSLCAPGARNRGWLLSARLPRAFSPAHWKATSHADRRPRGEVSRLG